MKDIFLVNYSVKGIKTLDELVSLSFYKKIITNNPDTQEYNIKGIYGMNGSGKSGIIMSVDILKNLLINPGYLNNTIVQKNLDAIINKKCGELFIEADFIAIWQNKPFYFRYNVTLEKNRSGKYVISKESMGIKRATSKSEAMNPVFEVQDGEIGYLIGDPKDELRAVIEKKTMNLLSTTSLSALFLEKILVSMIQEDIKETKELVSSLIILLYFGNKLHVYLDQPDDYSEYLFHNAMNYVEDLDNRDSEMDALLDNLFEMHKDHLELISASGNLVTKRKYKKFERNIEKLYEFLHIFKSDLRAIEIDKKEDQDFYVCNLVMVYDSYKIHAEFESTGIKKLIRLFVFLREMTQGGIVFIDELDSNLHDVYLCALLVYLMEYGEGQLCFTTHNLGPMDVLRKRKKSIDFLSEDHKIYSWKTSGNYSPSHLYKTGMIVGSPFNVDPIDFINAFYIDEEDD